MYMKVTQMKITTVILLGTFLRSFFKILNEYRFLHVELLLSGKRSAGR